MNVYIAIIYVSFINFVTAGDDIDYDTILTLIKQQTNDATERTTNLLNAVEKDESMETLPVIPGFYLQKPKELSSSLFKNPKKWPAGVLIDLGSENNSKYKGKSTRDDYLTAKILKAVKNLNKYRESHRYSESSEENVYTKETKNDGDVLQEIMDALNNNDNKDGGFKKK
ncbi:hypothetical protein HF086_016306 [Spodoptera exigua]|uniref:Uncharacterized protein n=1 Tax=Spodoptera exigua TaxID=7107 RepID=A0A922MKW4_SPOEX|nr:hypothetical protein HF086_016306 [Spodoptera exigua]